MPSTYHKLLQGFSGSLQLKTGKHCWYLTCMQEWQGHYLTEMLERCHHLIDMQSEDQVLGSVGVFHSTKISGNTGSKSNGTEIFRKFVSKISFHLSRLSFFLEMWKFRKFPVPFSISTQYEPAPVPLVVKSYNGGVSFESTLHWMQNGLP